MSWDDSTTLASILASVAAQERGQSTATRTPLAIGILRNYAVEPFLPILKHCCYAAGLQPQLRIGGYDTVMQEILDPLSPTLEPAPDIVLLCLLLEHLDPSSHHADWDMAGARAQVLAMLGALLERSRSLLVATTLLPPLHVEDALATALPSHRVRKVEAINDAMRDLASRHPHQLFLVDSARIVQQVGEERAFDPRYGYLYRAPFRKDFLGRMAATVAGIGRALKGGARKCLVLDCDNTLWGGIVGEDGLEGIALDPHEYPGRCFHDFQRAVLNLLGQGVILALCSKNNEADVWQVLDHHPHCLLRREHVSAWRIDWNHKPEGIAAIAAELKLGLDSLVFIDDSPMECDAVRQALPAVAVLQVPDEAALLPRLPFQGGWFDRIVASDEDARRSGLYAAERERAELRTAATDLDTYLASLGLWASVRRATEAELPRVAQLLGKTNQFNLTTRRHGEATVRAWHADPAFAVFTLSAGDRLGELGLVGVLIATRAGNDTEAAVDSLLLSCRALGRRLEWVFVEECLATLEREWGVLRWHATYVPTARNQQVRDFWRKAGFQASEAEDGTLAYTCAASDRIHHAASFIDLRRT